MSFGVGLSIVNEIIQAHQRKLELLERHHKGLTVGLIFQRKEMAV